MFGLAQPQKMDSKSSCKNLLDLVWFFDIIKRTLERSWRVLAKIKLAVSYSKHHITTWDLFLEGSFPESQKAKTFRIARFLSQKLSG